MSARPDTHLLTRPRRLLDPVDRICELLFGLIMVLTFTGSLSVAQADRDDIRAMLIGALGCNLAWGIIDAAFYLMATLTERGRGIMSVRAIRHAENAAQAHAIIAESLPPILAEALQPQEMETIHQRLKTVPEARLAGGLTRTDWLSALAVFAWVFVATFPVALPFLIMDEAKPALRISNAIAIGMLFWLGCAWGKYSGRQPWWMGLAMVMIGAVLIALTIALGG